MASNVHPRAGQQAERADLEDIPRLVSAYYTERPDAREPTQRVAFGTSGHRGSSLKTSFNDDHVAAITQAICEIRAAQGTSGPLYLGKDTHALSDPAHSTALEVLAANGVEVRVDAANGYVPTPALSHAILTHNQGRDTAHADGVVITPSHNPPADGGFKYNGPNGGPSDDATTRAIADRANELLLAGGGGVKRTTLAAAQRAATTTPFDYVAHYTADLANVVDLDAIRASGLKIGVDPMGGAGVAYWEPIAERYGLDLTIVDDVVDPRFAFMSLDRDGKIRMDCSSPWAMSRLIGMRDRFDVAFGNDTDFDRHGIVTPAAGLMNPNHFLAVSIQHLFANRPDWPAATGIGKTLVSSAMIDRVAAKLGRRLVEVPVGFKWFVDGLFDGTLGFGGEESAGASYLRRDGSVWTTDKDGIVMDLLAAEITAVSGKDPGELYAALAAEFGEPAYERIDAPATPAQKAKLKQLSADDVTATELAGEAIESKLTHAPGNGAAIGGLKVTTASGWFAARPSGTEEVYKIYAESFRGRDHLTQLQGEAQELVSAVFARC